MRKPIGIVFAFNGPPGIGKDSVADILVTDLCPAANRYAVVDHLKHRTAKAHGLVPEVFFNRDEKDFPLPPPYNATPRQLVIRKSAEERAKNGPCAIIRPLITQMANDAPPIALVTDLGTPIEAIELEYIATQVVIIQLHGEGFDFTNDCREYVNLRTTGIAVEICQRGETLEDTTQAVGTIIEGYL